MCFLKTIYVYFTKNKKIENGLEFLSPRSTSIFNAVGVEPGKTVHMVDVILLTSNTIVSIHA